MATATKTRTTTTKKTAPRKLSEHEGFRAAEEHLATLQAEERDLQKQIAETTSELADLKRRQQKDGRRKFGELGHKVWDRLRGADTAELGPSALEVENLERDLANQQEELQVVRLAIREQSQICNRLRAAASEAVCSAHSKRWQAAMARIADSAIDLLERLDDERKLRSEIEEDGGLIVGSIDEAAAPPASLEWALLNWLQGNRDHMTKKLPQWLEARAEVLL